MIILHLILFSRKRSDQKTGNTDNNRVSVRREVHIYEEINLGEMVPDYEDIDVVSDDHPSPTIPRTDLDADGFLNIEGQQHANQRPVSGNDHGSLYEDQRHDPKGYLTPIPSNHDVIECKYLTPPLPGATASPYSTPYDHIPWWQKALRSKLNRPR